MMRSQSLLARYVLARYVLARYVCLALFCSSAAFAQKAGVVTRFVAPAMIVEPAAKPGLKEVSVVAATNAPIKWNDVLRTGDSGRIRAQLTDGSILSVGNKSQLVVKKHDASHQQSEF